MEPKVLVNEHLIRNELYYGDVAVLSYVIKYPQFSLENIDSSDNSSFRTVTESIHQLNLYYNTKMILYQLFHIRKLYRLAIEDYMNAVKNDYPFHNYEVYAEYEITFNRGCVISLYFDKYEYTGGAHGMTVREGDSWNLLQGERITLEELYTGNTDLKEYVTSIVNGQIEANIQAGNNYYFDNYKELVVENFNPRDFYLTEEGVVIFYQLYDIAPYSSGILTFTIPYGENMRLPVCA